MMFYGLQYFITITDSSYWIHFVLCFSTEELSRYFHALGIVIVSQTIITLSYLRVFSHIKIIHLFLTHHWPFIYKQILTVKYWYKCIVLLFVYRYRDFRYPPGHVDEYEYSEKHWHVLAARFAFVVAFEVSLEFSFWKIE